MFARTENWRQFMSRYPLLSLIIAANAIVFIYTYVVYGSNQPHAVYELGGILPDAVERGEPWRFVTYAFLHSGWMHMIMNTAFMIIVAPPLEYMLGRLRMLVLYVLSVLATSGLVYATQNSAGVGVSGFCYGVLGTFAIMALRRKDLLDRASSQIVWGWIAVGWIGTLVMPGISVMGHLGGFLGGLLFGLLAVRPSTRLAAWVSVPLKRRAVEGQEEAHLGADITGHPQPHDEERHDGRS